MKAITLHHRTRGAFTFLVDDQDAPLLTAYHWYANVGRGDYVSARGRIAGQRVFLHRVILGLTKGDGLEGDHINHDTLDNRRANLRIVTHQGNQRNRKGGYGASPYRGVVRKGRRWRAQVKIDRKTICLGTYDTQEEAAAVAAEARARYFGQP